MGYEIDHIFVLTNAGAPAADAILQLGFTEGPPNRHERQGTANRRFFFRQCNARIAVGRKR
jgi:hypothetical protein